MDGMAYQIHAKNTEHGMRFRLWSAGIFGYLTEEMTEAEIDKYILMLVIAEAIQKHYRMFENHINYALEIGTSNLWHRKRNINGPWDDELGSRF